jgi:hypothetical protein
MSSASFEKLTLTHLMELQPSKTHRQTALLFENQFQLSHGYSGFKDITRSSEWLSDGRDKNIIPKNVM